MITTRHATPARRRAPRWRRRPAHVGREDAHRLQEAEPVGLHGDAHHLAVAHAIDSYRPGTTLARLSADAGYFDQSHFNREVRAVTGRSPAELLRAADHC
ncbi:MAG: AraC family transcriptional regulator [Polyangiaceae bacterium]